MKIRSVTAFFLEDTGEHHIFISRGSKSRQYLTGADRYRTIAGLLAYNPDWHIEPDTRAPGWTAHKGEA